MVDPDFLLLWDRWIRKVLALQLSNNAVGELSMHIRAWWWGQHTPPWFFFWKVRSLITAGRDGVIDGACGSCEPPVPLKWKRWNSFGTAFSSPKASLDGSTDREMAEWVLLICHLCHQFLVRGVLQYPSHQFFEHMHGALNIVEKNN